LDEWWLAAEPLFSVLSVSAALGEAMRDDSAAPVERFFARIGGLPFDFESDEGYIMAATTIAARLINQGLQNGHWGMVTTARPGELKLAYFPSNLVDAAYANLASLIATRAEFKECPGCGRMFAPASGKQKYHSPQCATRARQRRWKREKP
jgi:hypothetical protein